MAARFQPGSRPASPAADGVRAVRRLCKRHLPAAQRPDGASRACAANDTLPKKIRQGATRKIPNLLIIGEREVADGTVTLRRYGQRDQHTVSVDVFEAALLQAIRQRAAEWHA